MKTIKKRKKWRQTQSTKLRTDSTKKLSPKGEQMHQENYLQRWLEDRNTVNGEVAYKLHRKKPGKENK